MSGRKRTALEATAYHEAGHAVASWFHGRRFKHATIVTDHERGSLGHVRYAPMPKRLREDIELAMTPQTRIYCEVSIVCALAGHEAERRFAGRANNAGARGDYDHAMDLALRVCGTEDSATAFLAWLGVRTRELVGGVCWPRIEWLAKALLEQKTLQYSTAVTAIEGPDATLMQQKLIGAGKR